MEKTLDLIKGKIKEIEEKDPAAVGIDLGTTNSTVTVAQWCPNMGDIASECLYIEQKTLEGSYQSQSIPSIMAFYNGQVFVGEGAKRLRSRLSELKLEKNRDIFYECKNEIGVEKEYFDAPVDYNSPAKISGEIIKFLLGGVREKYGNKLDHITVTVPASFYVPQRKDTYFAAKKAGVDLEKFDLLDEPIAAFIDYLMRFREKLNLGKNKIYNLLVFDFGGGTCDIAIFSLNNCGRHLEITPRAVSRYYRLGGSDIDRSILYNLLLPKFFSENNLTEYDFDYDVKRNELEPQLINVAEVLKIDLCKKLSKKEMFKKVSEQQREQMVADYPQKVRVLVDSKEYFFTSPKISLLEFEKILEPFLDEDILYPIEGDFTYSCSIFSPLENVLGCANMGQQDIDLCFMVGGSSLIPQVKKAVSRFFNKAELLNYPDFESIKSCVSRGSAYHSLIKAATGKGLVQQVAYEDIFLRAKPDSIKIVEKGEKLSPEGEYRRISNLRVPEKEHSEEKNLLLEILVGDEKKSVMKATWTMPQGTRAGEQLVFEYSFDHNQVLNFKLSLLERPEVYLPGIVEYPSTHIVNPHNRYHERLELEKKLERKRIELDEEELIDTFFQLVKLYLDEGMKEKALNLCKKALLDCPKKYKKYFLSSMGRIAGEMQDFDREEKFYLEAEKEDSLYSVPCFNLALSQYRRREYCKAKKNINKAINRDPLVGANYVLKALILNSLKDYQGKKESLSDAFHFFKNISLLNDWELSWYIFGAELGDDEERLTEANKERIRRSERGINYQGKKDGDLPEIINEPKRWGRF